MKHDDLDEALARAAYESTAAVGTYDPPWDKLPAGDKTPFREMGELWHASLSMAGFAIVPVEPTEAMIAEYRVRMADVAEHVWRIMLTAAQEPKP